LGGKEHTASWTKQDGCLLISTNLINESHTLKIAAVFVPCINLPLSCGETYTDIKTGGFLRSICGRKSRLMKFVET
jgi:hypothetical protein